MLNAVDAKSYVNGKPQPCKWDKVTTFVIPPSLSTTVHQTEAAGINNEGWIVGNYLDDSPNPDTSHAFRVKSDANGDLITGTFATIDFAPCGGGDNAATAINKTGVIVGNFEDTRPPYSSILPKERAWIRREQ